MFMNIIDIINLIKKEEKLTKGEISARIGIKQSYLSDMIAGRKPVSFEMKHKINKAFPYCYADEFPTATMASQDDYKAIPFFDGFAVGGKGGFTFALTQQDVKNYYVVPKFKDKHIDFMIEVTGSSMYPKYNSGDVVACTIINENTFIQWNKVHVIATKEQGLLIKRLHKCDDDSKLTLISDNNDYPPFDIPKDEICGIAIVTGVIRLE